MTEAHEPPVGRDRVVGLLEDELKQAVAGQARVALISGEAGIGKTSMLDALVARARRLDCEVLLARAHEYDRGMAYATLRQSLTSAELTDDPLRAQAGELTEAVDRLQLQGGDGIGGHHDVGHSLLALTTRLMETLCNRRPAVVAIDDAHLADPESLVAVSTVLRHLRRQPLLVVTTTRPEGLEPHSVLLPTVGRLIQDEQGSHVELAPLDVLDIRALLANLLDSTPDEKLVHRIYHHSRGNPLFARESLLGLQARGAVRNEHGRCYLVDVTATPPVSPHGMLLHRVFQQDPDGRALARVMAPFRQVRLDDLALLSDLAQLPAERLHAAFDGLVRGGILLRTDDSGYGFVHPLMAEVLYHDLGPAERRRLHARIVSHLQGAPWRVSPLELATHVAEAAAPGDAEAARLLVDAAAMTQSTAPLSAADWYGRALDLLDPGDPQRAELLARQCVLWWKGSRADAAVAAGRAALGGLAPGRRRTRTVATVVNAAFAVGRLREGLDLVTAELDGDPAGVGRAPALLAQRAVLLTELEGASDQVDELRQAAWEQVTAAPLPPDVTALTHLGHLANNLGNYTEMAEAADRLVAAGDALPPSARLSAVESAAYVLAVAGCARRAGELLTQATALGERTGWRDMGGQRHYAAALWRFWTGDWDRALDEARAGAVSLELAGLDCNRTWLRLIEGQLLVERGRFEDAAALLAAPVTADSQLQHAILAFQRARLALAGSSTDQGAVEVLEELRDQARRTGWTSLHAGVVELLADAYLAAGATDRASEIAEELAGLAGSSGMPWIACSAGWVLALCTGQVVPAQAALEVAEAHGLLLLKAHIQLALGARGHEPAGNLLAAHDAYQRFGAVRWKQRTRAVMRERRVTPRRAARAAASGPLTPTERQLVELVRQGLTNRQVSEALHYSPKTVEAYLGRVYAKTGCRGRVELVRALERDELALLGPSTDAE
jgi:DNA-binding CsgD family transcriptional regulator